MPHSEVSHGLSLACARKNAAWCHGRQRLIAGSAAASMQALHTKRILTHHVRSKVSPFARKCGDISCCLLLGRFVEFLLNCCEDLGFACAVEVDAIVLRGDSRGPTVIATCFGRQQQKPIHLWQRLCGRLLIYPAEAEWDISR